MPTIIGDIRNQMIEMQQDPKWLKLREEVDGMISAQTEQLLNCEDPAECVRLQERIKSLRFCTRLPQIIAEREET